ncbi:MAG: 2'-5' RNA ligase family protein, partial [Halobacteriaceae archaeon]
PDLKSAGIDTRKDSTLLVKRLDGGDVNVLDARVREALNGAPAVESRISTIDYFQNPVKGNTPVVYLAVTSPGLLQIHERLCSVRDPVSDLEGDEFVPHITLGRGSESAVKEVANRDIDPVSWTVTRLHLLDVRRGETVSRYHLPA